MVFVFTRDSLKAITSVQRAGNDIQKTRVNGYNVPFVNNGFTKHVFTSKSNFYLVSDGTNVFFHSLI